jgi:hypothetical protein
LSSWMGQLCSLGALQTGTHKAHVCPKSLKLLRLSQELGQPPQAIVKSILLLLLSLSLLYWGLSSGLTFWASLPALFFVMVFLRDRVLWTICLGWLQTLILLISVSWVVMIAGVSHQYPALFSFFKCKIVKGKHKCFII